MLCLIAVPALLVTTWIVDQSNGPGTNFTDLPQAVAVASSGDTIIVRPGYYTPFQVSGKALTILGAGSAITIVSLPAPAGALNGETQVQGVPAGSTFYISGLRFAPPFPAAAPPLSPAASAGLRILASAGPVVLSDVIGQPASYSGDGPSIPGLWASDAEVHVSRCAFVGTVGSYTSGGAGAHLTSVAFSADQTTFTGASAPFYLAFGGSGLALSNSYATLAHCSAYGGGGTLSGGAAVNVGFQSFLRAAGTASDAFVGGATLVIGGVAAVAAVPGSSAVLHGPITVLPGGGIGPPTTGSVTIGAPALPYVAITGAVAPGGDLSATQPVTVTINGVLALAPYALLMDGAPAFLAVFTPLLMGELLVPFPPALIAEGTLDATGMAQLVVVPAVVAPAVVGVPIYAQLLVFDAVAANFRLSNQQIRRFQ